MVDVFVERVLDAPVGEQDLREPVPTTRRCFDLHNVQWQESIVSADGQRVICRFSAADAESVRLALRRAGIEFRSVWSCRRVAPADRSRVVRACRGEDLPG